MPSHDFAVDLQSLVKAAQAAAEAIKAKKDEDVSDWVPEESACGHDVVWHAVDSFQDLHEGGGGPSRRRRRTFTKAADDVIPEFQSSGSMRNGAERWEALPDGNQRLVTVLRDGAWVLQGNP